MLVSKSKSSSTGTNHVLIVDISGSMYSCIVKLREELKNRIAATLNPNDCLSIIWFSGKNEAGFVLKDFTVENASSLSVCHTAIDKWLRPICLTAFDKPLILAKEVAQPNRSNSLTFFSDGANNDAKESDVLKALVEIKDLYASFEFISFGTYADERLLAKMAQLVGGSQSMQQGVINLAETIEKRLSVAAAPRIEVSAPSGCTHLFGFDGDSLIIYPVENGKAFISSTTIHTLPIIKGHEHLNFKAKPTTMDLLILALGFAMMNHWKNVEDCITAISDEDLLNQLGGAYGIQPIEQFKILLLEAIKGNVSLSPTEGASIDENAFCVFDLLELLTTTKGNFLLPDHEAFNYKRIGVAKTAKVAEEVKEASSAAALLGIDVPIKPIAFEKIAGQEIPLEKLTLNTERANVSLFATYKGKVVNIPANGFGITEYETVQHRNYTIIQDGRLNVTTLPVKLSKEFFVGLSLDAANKIFDAQTMLDDVNIIDLTKIPIINRSRIKSLNSVDATKKAFELLKVRAALKVIKTLRPDNYNAVDNVEPEIAEFLKSIGITSQGFSPKVETADASDFYYAPELTFSFAGASALPSVAKVKEKVQKIVDWAENPKGKEPKLNLAEALMVQALKVAEVVTEDKATEFAAKINEKKRSLERELSAIVSTLILSRGWFQDKADFDDNKVSLDTEFGQVDCTINFRDVEVKI